MDMISMAKPRRSEPKIVIDKKGYLRLKPARENMINEQDRKQQARTAAYGTR